ncbi:hypothetical protein Tco_1524459 [Tanacetum coccineum]
MRMSELVGCNKEDDGTRIDSSVGFVREREELLSSKWGFCPSCTGGGGGCSCLTCWVHDLDTHSSLEADPSESSLPPVSVAPMVSPFLCSDDSESDTEMPERHVSPTPHDAMLTRWRSRVASRSSSPTTSTPKIPTAPIPPTPSDVVAPSTDIISPVDAPLGIRRRRAILIRPGQDIPIGRLYRTHPDCITFGTSSSHSSSDHSSSGHSILGHSVSGHTSPDTTIADSFALSRFVYPPLTRTPRYSEAYRRWRSALLSTMYPPTTSESSAGDSFSESSLGPSRKRCRSPGATVTSSIHALRALVPSHSDLLPPLKSFRDFISPEDSVEEDIDTDVLVDIEIDVTAVGVAADIDVEAGVDAGISMEVDVEVYVEDEDEVEGEIESSDRGTMEVGVDVVVGIDIPDGMLMPDIVEHLEQVEEVVQDIYGHAMEIPLQRVEDIETGQRELEARSLIAGGERASLLDQVTSLERSNVILRGTLMMKSARADRFQRRMGFMESELRLVVELVVSSNISVNQVPHYGLSIKTITRSGMTPEAIEELINQRVAEALATYEENRAAKLAVKSQSQNGDDDDNGNNAQKRTIGADVAFSMSWRELLKLMTERFQELTMMCTKIVPEEEDRVEKFIGGLPDNIQGNVIIAEPTRLQDVVCIFKHMMIKSLKCYAVKSAEKQEKAWITTVCITPITPRPNDGVRKSVARYYEHKTGW